MVKDQMKLCITFEVEVPEISMLDNDEEYTYEEMIHIRAARQKVQDALETLGFAIEPGYDAQGIKQW